MDYLHKQTEVKPEQSVSDCRHHILRYILLTSLTIIILICLQGISYGDEPKTTENVSYIVNGVELPLDEDGYRIGDYRGSGTCWEFCQHVYEAIWGVSFSQFRGSEDDVLKDDPVDDGSRVISADSAKEFLMRAAPGAVVRVQTDPESMDSNSGNRHSFIILALQDDGCTVYHAWAGYVAIDTLTWEEIEEHMHTITDFGSFKYIKYPG